MKPLTREDLLSLDEYERQRDAYRSRIIALKQRRRLSLGSLITLVFENRETLQFQVQEMIRAERIVQPTKVQDELDVYNALLPAANEADNNSARASRVMCRVHQRRTAIVPCSRGGCRRWNFRQPCRE